MKKPWTTSESAMLFFGLLQICFGRFIYRTGIPAHLSQEPIRTGITAMFCVIGFCTICMGFSAHRNRARYGKEDFSRREKIMNAIGSKIFFLSVLGQLGSVLVLYNDDLQLMRIVFFSSFSLGCIICTLVALAVKNSSIYRANRDQIVAAIK